MIRLKNFTELNLAEIYLVLAWRNDIKIASFMKTNNISLKRHLQFLKELKEDESKKYFLVYEEGDEGEEILGVIDFINIKAKSCEFGLYQNPHLRGRGEDLMREIKKYAFEILGVSELKALVLKHNERALKLYLKNGFKIQKEEANFILVSFENVGGGGNFQPCYARAA